ncbi:MAG TPA: hypothetical protein VG797_05710 [Phycisphaerales bacterium]|nr:hypothetical protein [Phycisphaerales bacterium]
MEFLPYSVVSRTLRDRGIVERREGEGVRYTLRLPGTESPEGFVAAFGPAGSGAGADRRIEVPREAVASSIDCLLKRAHLGELALIPFTTWRPVLDLCAFDLAKDAAWLEIDAEASVQQNPRDPSVVPPKSRHIVRVFAAALASGGEHPAHSLTVAAMETPIVIELHHDGTARLRGATRAIVENLLGKL